MRIYADSLIDLIKKKTGHTDSYRVSLYIIDVLRDCDEVRNMIAEHVIEDMENNEEFADETQRDRL